MALANIGCRDLIYEWMEPTHARKGMQTMRQWIDDNAGFCLGNGQLKKSRKVDCICSLQKSVAIGCCSCNYVVGLKATLECGMPVLSPAVLHWPSPSPLPASAPARVQHVLFDTYSTQNSTPTYLPSQHPPALVTPRAARHALFPDRAMQHKHRHTFTTSTST